MKKSPKTTKKAPGFFERNFTKPLSQVAARFPVPMIFAGAITVTLSIAIISGIRWYGESFWMALLLSLSAGFFLSVGIDTWREYRPHPLSLLWHLISVAYTWLFFLYTENNIINMVTVGVFFLHIFCFMLTPFWIGYLRKENTDEKIYNDIQGKLIALLLSCLFTLILVLLGLLAIFAVIYLFDNPWYGYDEKIIQLWVTVMCFFFAPTYMLSRFPMYSASEKSQYRVYSHDRFAIFYILIPFTVLYMLILYTYTGKVLLHFSEWPKGMISHMVIWFSFVGYFTYMMSQAFHTTNSGVVWFRRILPYAVLLQTIMLFYAIYLRIDQYGITANRYLVVAIGVGLVLVSLYFIFSRYKRIFVVPMVFSIMAFLISVGPWSVYQLPYTQQWARAQMLMEEMGIYDKQTNSFTPFDESTMDTSMGASLYSSIEYACSYSTDSYYSCPPHITAFFAPILDEKDTNRWWDIVETLQLPSSDYRALPHIDTKIHSYNFRDFPDTHGTVPVSGYDYFVPHVFVSANFSESASSVTIPTVTLHRNELFIGFQREWWNLSLAQLANELANLPPGHYKNDGQVLSFETASYTFTWHITSASFDTEDNTIQALSGPMLIREK